MSVATGSALGSKSGATECVNIEVTTEFCVVVLDLEV